MKTQESARLIRNTLPRRKAEFKPIQRQLGRAALEPKTKSDGPHDPFQIKGRTIDQVVDCLLKELSW